MNLEHIADHTLRILIEPRTNVRPDSTSYRTWICTIELRFDPPHHTAISTGSTAEDAVQQAIERAETHIAIATGSKE